MSDGTKSWQELNSYTQEGKPGAPSGRNVGLKRYALKANSIVRRLLESERFTLRNKHHALNVKRSCTALWNAAGVYGHLMTPFCDLELSNVIEDLKTGKAQGPDNVHPNSSKKANRNVALGSVISFPHVSTTYRSQKSDTRQ